MYQIIVVRDGREVLVGTVNTIEAASSHVSFYRINLIEAYYRPKAA
jgi:hypothetical protein